jgi:hypothetical protein
MFFAMAKGESLSADKSEVPQGTLNMMILKTLHALGPLHGFGIARRIEQVSEDVLTLNEGTVYTSLLRLQQQVWIESEWGTSENMPKGKLHSKHQHFHSMLPSVPVVSILGASNAPRQIHETLVS